MKTFPTDWKRSYWPEPRFGKAKESRASVVARKRAENAEALEAAKAARIAAALNAD